MTPSEDFADNLRGAASKLSLADDDAQRLFFADLLARSILEQLYAPARHPHSP